MLSLLSLMDTSRHLAAKVQLEFDQLPSASLTNGVQLEAADQEAKCLARKACRCANGIR
jgi:hypothetical protein